MADRRRRQPPQATAASESSLAKLQRLEALTRILCTPVDIRWNETPDTLTAMIASATNSMNESEMGLRNTGMTLEAYWQVGNNAHRSTRPGAHTGQLDPGDRIDISALQMEIKVLEDDIAATQTHLASLRRRYEYVTSPLRQSREQHLAAIEQAVNLHNEVGIVVQVSLGRDRRTQDYIRRWTEVNELLSSNVDFQTVRIRKENEQRMRIAHRAAAGGASSSKDKERKARK